jgi:endonuclease-3 related protein
VQNTAWRNADLAIGNLRANRLLAPIRLAVFSPAELEVLIRPAGFQRQKSSTLLRLSHHVTQATASFEAFLTRPMLTVREELLAVRGIGPETADSILLYAGGHEIFVVDTHLRRFLAGIGFEKLSRAMYEELRLGLEKLICDSDADFQELLSHLHAETPSHPASAMSRRQRTPLADIYNELHAALVRDGVEKRRPGAYAPGRKNIS